jgi:4-methyl-5(b-hydroxyethyl)-thiazole monophosphate biosynthesis
VQEIEAVCIVDVLRRAGADVTLASVEDSLLCTMSRGVKIQARLSPRLRRPLAPFCADAACASRVAQADVSIAACAGQTYDLIALPGGMPGAERLRDSAPLAALLAAHAASGRPYAAMCAAPAVVLAPAGLLSGRAATAHPAFAAKLAEQGSVSARVVMDGNVVTSRGPGTALEFSLALVSVLFGEDKAREVAGPMVMQPGEAAPRLPHEWRL